MAEHPSKVSPNVSEGEASKVASFDGIEAPDDVDDSYHSYLGSTHNDRQDMNRMGKTQELRVSTN